MHRTHSTFTHRFWKTSKKSIDHNKQPAKADIGRLITCERSSLQPRLDSRLRLRREEGYGSYPPEMPFWYQRIPRHACQLCCLTLRVPTSLVRTSARGTKTCELLGYGAIRQARATALMSCLEAVRSQPCDGNYLLWNAGTVVLSFSLSLAASLLFNLRLTYSSTHSS